MVKFGGCLARTAWALTAIWLGDGRRGRCRARIQRLLRPARQDPSTTWLLGRMSVSGLGYDLGAARVRANVAPGRIWTASMGLAQVSPSHWLRVAGLLLTLMIAGAGWSETQARSPRKDPPQR